MPKKAINILIPESFRRELANPLSEISFRRSFLKPDTIEAMNSLAYRNACRDIERSFEKKIEVIVWAILSHLGMDNRIGRSTLLWSHPTNSRKDHRESNLLGAVVCKDLSEEGVPISGYLATLGLAPAMDRSFCPSKKSSKGSDPGVPLALFEELQAVAQRHIHAFTSEMIREPGRHFFTASFFKNRPRQEKVVAIALCKRILSLCTGRFFVLFQKIIDACVKNMLVRFGLYSKYRFLYIQRVLKDYTPSLLDTLGLFRVKLVGAKRHYAGALNLFESVDFRKDVGFVTRQIRAFTVRVWRGFGKGVFIHKFHRTRPYIETVIATKVCQITWTLANALPSRVLRKRGMPATVACDTRIKYNWILARCVSGVLSEMSLPSKASSLSIQNSLKQYTPEYLNRLGFPPKVSLVGKPRLLKSFPSLTVEGASDVSIKNSQALVLKLVRAFVTATIISESPDAVDALSSKNRTNKSRRVAKHICDRIFAAAYLDV
jgi:hypothetical protein